MGWQLAGFAFATLLAGSEPGKVSIDLSVRGLEDSRPISGVELVVEAFGKADVAPTVSPEDDAGDARIITRAESNDRGEIRLTGLPAVRMRLTLRANGFVSPVLPALDGSPVQLRQELFLSPATVVTGVVVDDEGVPVPGVEVSIPLTLDLRRRVVATARPLVATTDAQGNFRIEGTPLGIGQFAITASGYALSFQESAHFLSDEPLRLIVRRTGVLRVDIDAPIHRRGQYKIKVVQRVDAGQPLSIEKQAADRGVISFSDLPAGKYTVTAWIPSRRKPEPPFSGTAEVVVGKPTEVRLGPPIAAAGQKPAVNAPAASPE